MGTSFNYRGYTIIHARHPTALNPARATWDIYDSDKRRKANIASVELAKKYIDTMIKYSYWMQGGSEKIGGEIK